MPTEEANGSFALRRSRWADERTILEKIGRYTILGQIAGGGMGSVFIALMRGPAHFSRLVAIKCLHTRWLDDPKYVARFTTEVKLSTRIRHPNVVQTLDVVDEAGELFLVMEFVDGVTLSALLADSSRYGRALPVELVLGIMSSVLRGLHAAHEAADENGVPLHIVHRDVSPQNIMVSRQGHVQVLDFGAAKAVEHSQHTAAGVLVGKLAYMAPEQVRGERSSPRSDVFAAGVVLWEALAGKRLFYDPGLGRSELLQALVLKPVARPSTLRSDVPLALDEVVRKALERNPNRRYQNALEFAVALEALGAAVTGTALGNWVGEVCATRLADKDSLIRSGMAAAASEPSESTPLPHLPRVRAEHVQTERQELPHHPSGARAGLVQRMPTFPGFVLASRPLPLPLRGSRPVWGLGVVLLGLGLWASGKVFRGAPEPSSFGLARQSPAHVAAAAPALDPLEDRVEVASDAPMPPPRTPTVATVAAVPPVQDLTVQVEPVRVSGKRTRRAAFGSLDAPSASSGASPASYSATSFPARGARKPGPDCDPPTYMDAAGIRHFKKDCL